MDNSSNSNSNNSKLKIQNFAKDLRAKASAVKESRSDFAEGFIAGMSEGVKSFGHLIEIAESVVAIYRSVEAVSTAVVNDSGVRGKVKTLIENTANDIATRMNEFSGVMDYISTSEPLVQEFEKFDANIKNIEDKISKTIIKKRKFSVVQDDDDGGGSTTH